MSWCRIWTCAAWRALAADRRALASARSASMLLVLAWRSGGGRPGLPGRPGRRRVGRTCPASALGAVGAGDLTDLDPGGLDCTGQPGPVGAGALDADHQQLRRS